MTGVGVAGALTTAYLTGKASFKAAELITAEKLYRNVHDPLMQNENGGDSIPARRQMDNKEKIKLVWKEYIPAGLSLAMTATAIVAAHRAGSRRAAGLVAAYSVVQKSFEDYREIVLDKIGEVKEREVQVEAAQRQVDANPPEARNIILTGNGQHFCLERASGQYFKSTMEAIRRAEIETYAQILNDGYASVGDFYERLGIRETSFSDQLGWRSDGKKFELVTDVILQDDIPTITIGFRTEPIPNYYKGH